MGSSVRSGFPYQPECLVGKSRPRNLSLGFLAAIALTACGGEESLTGPAAESCGTGPFFGTLPVALGDIEAIPVFGGLGAPGHTLPTAHTGFHLLRVGAPVVAPPTCRSPAFAALAIWSLPTDRGSRTTRPNSGSAERFLDGSAT